MSNEEIYKAIEEKYGIEAMTDVLIEELLEFALILQQAKRPDKHINRNQVLKEYVDVLICMEQFELLQLDYHDINMVNILQEKVMDDLPQKLKL